MGASPLDRGREIGREKAGGRFMTLERLLEGGEPPPRPQAVLLLSLKEHPFLIRLVS